jgi:hypothetical protein
MIKSSKKRTAAPTRSPRKRAGSKNLSKKPADQRPKRAGTKQSTAIEMLRSPDGTTLEALMKATNWQQHSVRGFLAGAVRKRLKLNLDSTVIEGRRVYRVIGGDAQRTAEAQAKRTTS